MKKILIIEDDSFLGDVLVQKLKGEGFEVSLARDGAEGLKDIREIKPDLILLDIVLPTMNGYEILEAKQADKEISTIPVIVISNSGQPVEISRVLSLGVKDYLVKAQFDPQEVVSKVKSQLIKGNEAAGSKTSGELPRGAAALAGKKVMWVEDDKFLSDIIARKLSSTGCTLFHAPDGEAALKLIAEQMPDIIMLDVLLPGMDGFEVLHRIKADPKTSKVPVIMLSNLNQKVDIDKSKELGAAQFLVKATMSLDEIIENIRLILK
ncbi:MAG TPA: response regulator [Candidatus Paceibacterota bacterium]